MTGFFAGPEEFGRYSKYCEALHLELSLGEERIVRELMRLAGQCAARPVLFPTSDYYTAFLARHRERLSGHFSFHWVDEATLSGVVDKARMNGICREAGVRVPRTHVVGLDEDLAALARTLPFPCLVKPSRSFDNAFPARRKNFVAGSPEDFLAFYRAHPRLKGETVCQEIIEGGDENVFQCTVLMRRSGEVGAAFGARKLRQYRPGYGVMCFGRSEENEVVKEQALRLLNHLRYRGLASLEFKYRASDGRYYFIEMNPRLPWYSALCADAGVNLPQLAYLELTDDRPARALPSRQRNGVHWICFKLDLGWFLLSRDAGHARLSFHIEPGASQSSYADLRQFLVHELLPVATPAGTHPAAGGDHELGAGLGETLHVDLVGAGLVREVSDPPAVGGELAEVLVELRLQIREGFAIPLQRQHPEVETGLGVLERVEEEAAVGRQGGNAWIDVGSGSAPHLSQRERRRGRSCGSRTQSRERFLRCGCNFRVRAGRQTPVDFDGGLRLALRLLQLHRGAQLDLRARLCR